MRKIRNIGIAAVLILAMTVITGCTTYQNFKATFFGEQGVKSDTIKIGVLEPQTGNDSKMGNEEIRGIELAHKLVPSVLDKEIELVYADTQSSIYAAETAVTDLISKDPAVVLGSYGDTTTLIASQMLGEAKIPAITITATNPLITTNNPFYFRVSCTDASQGNALGYYVVKKLGLKKAAIIRMEADDTTNELISKFKVRMRRLTADQNCIVATVDINEKNNDYEHYLQPVKDAQAKAVFMPVSLTVAEKVFQQADKMAMYDVNFIVPKDLHGDELLQAAKKYPKIKVSVSSDLVSNVEEAPASGAETTSVYDQFVGAYTEQYQGAEPTEEAALAFDAYMIAVKAIEISRGTDPEMVREAMLKTSNFDGASGRITFDETGEPQKPINVDIIQNGIYVSVFTVK